MDTCAAATHSASRTLPCIRSFNSRAARRLQFTEPQGLPAGHPIQLRMHNRLLEISPNFTRVHCITVEREQMRLVALSLLFAVSLIRCAAAQTVSGSYALAGKNFDGSTYVGTVQ